MFKLLVCLPFLVPALFCLPAFAQHCGGPCEITRGPDPQPAVGKYTLSKGTERSNGRYIDNW